MVRKWFRLFIMVSVCCTLFFGSRQVLRADDGNGFTTPTANEVVSGIIRLRGTANAADFAKWQVDLLLFGDEKQATHIAQAQRARNNGNLGTLDTTRYPDGAHLLRLRVVHSNFQHDEYFLPVTIDNSVTPPIVNGVTRPRDGITVSRTILIEGIARGPQFQKWQLDLLRNGDAAQASTLATGDDPLLMAGELTEFDTMKLPNGPYQLRLRVVYDGGTYEDHLMTMLVSNTYVPTAANNGLLRPREGEVVQGDVRVQGIADDPTFRKWQLDLVNPTTGDDTFLAWNRDPKPTRGGLTTFDSTRYPDGVYQLRLRVVRGDYNYSEYFTTITLANSGASANGATPADSTGGGQQ